MNPSQLQPAAPVSPGRIVLRGIGNRCPNCGRGHMFEGVLRIHKHCPGCGMKLDRGDGFYLGALCINWGLVVFVWVIPVLIAGFAGVLSVETGLALGLAGTLLLPVLLYRSSWSWWLMAYYLCLPHELHANADPDSDDLSFEEDRRS